MLLGLGVVGWVLEGCFCGGAAEDDGEGGFSERRI